MELFYIIDGGVAILCSKGIYKQTKIFRRGKDIYAAFGGGYIKLYNKSLGTSVPRITWLSIEGENVSLTTNGTPTWIESEVKSIKRKKK